MPFSVNGFGTGLIRASRRRSVQGLIQYDAIEAVVLCMLPVFPYRVVHVVASDGDRYQALRLRFSPRIVVKAFLRSWGLGLLLLGLVLGIFAVCAVANPARVHTEGEWTFLRVCIGMVVGGLGARLAWWVQERGDDRLRRLFGSTPAGTSDPMDWPEVIARPVVAELMSEAGSSSLADAAFRLHERGELGKAAVCARLAETRGEAAQARELLARWLQNAR
jgi:hypothetical protein